MDITYSIEVDRIPREEWSILLRRFDDAHIVQTWDFAGCISPGQQVSRLLLRRGNEAVALAQVRILAIPILRRGVARVAFGPVWRPSGTAPDLCVFEAAVAALREEYAVKRKLLLRISPYFVGGESAALEEAMLRLGFAPPGRSGQERTIVVDISRPLPEIRRSLDRDWRKYLNRSERIPGVEVRQGTSPELYDEFLKIYFEMLGRKELEMQTDADRWAALQAALPEAEKPTIFLVLKEGIVVSGLVVSALGDTGFPILGASTVDGRKCFASYLMHWRAIAWLREGGCRHYDLVGVDPARNPGTYHFKKGFGGREMPTIGVFEGCTGKTSAALVHLAEPILETALRFRRTFTKWRIGRALSKAGPG